MCVVGGGGGRQREGEDSDETGYVSGVWSWTVGMDAMRTRNQSSLMAKPCAQISSSRLVTVVDCSCYLLMTAA